MSEDGLFERIRLAAQEVTRRARHVHIDAEALESFAALLARERPPQPTLDPAGRRLRDPAVTLAYVLTLDAINFGSGYFPHLRKSPGMSGYLTIATRLREHFEAKGPWSAAALGQIEPADLGVLLGQPLDGPAGELMALFARALRDLGEFLARDWRGRFEGPVRAAAGSAEGLVGILAAMPLYGDVAVYQGFEMPFYKRAQITCSDLALAFQGRGLGAFRDLDQLTLFADNLVPHVLRMLGVLVYAPALVGRIEAEELIPSGSEEEVEIRAVALHAVELLASSCRRRGWRVAPHRLDHLLWGRGQSPRMKASPRHRTRCAFY